MNTIIIIGAILVVLGILGSVIPAMPGPILSFIAIILLYFHDSANVSISSLIFFGIGMVALLVLGYIGPILGAKYLGASKKGLWGALIGALLGAIFFPPLGIFLGALLGAFLAEIIAGKKIEVAMKSALGVIMGSVFVMILQLLYSLFAAGYFFFKLF